MKKIQELDYNIIKKREDLVFRDIIDKINEIIRFINSLEIEEGEE